MYGEALIDQKFARKTIHLAGPITKEDVENEAAAVEKLRTQSRHANVVQVFTHDWMVSLGRTSPLPVYFVDMELCRTTLEDFIRDYDPVVEFDVWSIMLDIQRGLMFLHQRHMIHRDLKPANSNVSLCALADVYSPSRNGTWSWTLLENCGFRYFD